MAVLLIIIGLLMILAALRGNFFRPGRYADATTRKEEEKGRGPLQVMVLITGIVMIVVAMILLVIGFYTVA